MASISTHIQCWDGYTELVNVERCINQGHLVLILMRGVPGSGKSHLAKELVKNTLGCILSTDDFFMENGVYKFDPSRLSENHKKNLNEAKTALLNGVKPIIIDNTNICAAHMNPYIKQALRYQYEIYFVEPQTEWKHKAQVCAAKNTHGVQAEKISYLLDTYEFVSLANLIKPVVLKLVPPSYSGFEDDSLATNSEKNRSCISHVRSWSGLLPSGGEGSRWGFFAANFWETPHASLNSNVCGGSSTFKDNHVNCKEALNQAETAQSQWRTDSRQQKQKANSEPKVSRKVKHKCTNMQSSDDNSICKEGSSCHRATDNISFFSLLPESQMQVISYQSVGVQTNDIIRTLFVRGILCAETVQEAVITKSEVFMMKRSKDLREIRHKERASQTATSSSPTELEMLLSMFPYEAPADLLHLLQTCGFESAIGINFEMHAQMDLFANVVEDASSIDMLNLSESYELKQENMGNELFNLVHPSNLAVNPGPMVAHQELPPSSSKQRCSPEQVKDGHYRMELSVDMIQKLLNLFDNGEENGAKKAYVDLPFWFCRQLFEYWQGLPITAPEGEGFKCGDFDTAFPSVNQESSRPIDNEIVSNLKLLNFSSNNRDSDKTVRRKLTTAQKLQLNSLCEEFPGVDRERIEECYYDTNFSGEAVKNTLNMFLEQEDIAKDFSNNLSHERACDNKAAGELANRSNIACERALRINLEAVQNEVDSIQDEIDYCTQQRDSLYRKGANTRVTAAKQFYLSDAQNYDKRARALIKEKNERLSRANSSRNFVDLHHMSVSAAIKLLKEKLSCLDRPPNLRNGRSDRKLTVVTGYGKSSVGPIKLKPAVLQWLNQLQYDYYLSNPGEIIITAK